MSEITPEGQEFLATISSFLEATDSGAAGRLADAHPELRIPGVVRLLVDGASQLREQGDRERSASLLAHAGLLCGLDWPDGPFVVTGVVTIAAIVEASSVDPTASGEAMHAAGRVLDAVATGVVHPILLPGLLDTVSFILASRYEATGDRDLLDEATNIQRRAVDSTPPDSSELASRLHNLDLRLAALYVVTSDRSLLDEAVRIQRRAVASTSLTSAHLSSRLNNLANRLAALYAVTGDRGLLDEAVEAQRRAVTSAVPASNDLFERLNNLALHLGDLHAATGDRDLLDEAVMIHRGVVDSTPLTSTDLPGRLNNLASRLTDLYKATGQEGLLEEAVDMQRRVVDITPQAGVELPRYLSNLAASLADLHEATGQKGLLEEAVEIQQRAVDITPPTSVELPRHLNGLAARLARLSVAAGRQTLLEEAVEIQRRVVDITPPASVELPRHLNNLSAHLANLYVLKGGRALLDEAVEAQRRAIDITPPTSTELSGQLSNLANRLTDLYEVTSERALLDEAVVTQRRAVEVVPPTSTDLPRRLNNLALRLARLYRVTGDRALLDEAVETQRRAVEAAPPAGAALPAYLDNLALCLIDLHAATGDRSLLDEAVETQRRAVNTTPPTSTDLPRHLSNLTTGLAELFAATGDQRLLNEALEIQRRAVDATPLTSTELPAYLGNLANRLAELYAATGDRASLEEAVATQRRAVETTFPTSPDLAGHLNNLASHLAHLHAATGDRALLDEAVDAQRRAVETTPPSSTDLASRLSNLANRLAELYAVTSSEHLLDEAWAAVDGLASDRPWDRVLLATTRAGLIRQNDRTLDRSTARPLDRYTIAARELTVAYDAFRDELHRLRADHVRRRDLAQRMDGLLGDLAVNHMLGGDVKGGLRLIESDRMWLPAPEARKLQPSEPDIVIAWVATSQWETTVITLDHNKYSRHVVPRTREDIHGTIRAVMNSTRTSGQVSIDVERPPHQARMRAVDALCELTSGVVAAFPPATERLLVVPLGICALLPYAAARRAGKYLIDQTTITIAPTLAWAQAARRSRPQGPSIGVFHVGTPPFTPLDLAEDKQAFTELVRGEILDAPTADEVVARLAASLDIAHFSCHGAYNSVTPLASWLDLGTELTIQMVLDHATAPWLVNLSACETAVPDLQAAEQLIAFPTGFLLGGAAHVLATLWPVANDYASAVNRHTYQQLAVGAHPADALRHAIQRLRGIPVAAAAVTLDQSDQAELHPYWWAPFTHYGSPW